jgi:pentatricopeptide repeat protein
MKLNVISLVFILLLIHVQAIAQTPANLCKVATRFINTLSAAEQKSAMYNFDDKKRVLWTNLPVGQMPRPGIRYGDLSDSSRLAFHRLLSETLSSQGYLKTTSIMQLDDILNVLYQKAFDDGKIKKELFTMTQNLKWDHGNYYISFFGRPALNTAWSFNLGGHHIALSMTTDGKKISVSPYFIGSDPAEVKSGKYAGLRVLSKEEDYGFLLIHALTDKQKTKAILSQSVPKDIITNPTSKQRINTYYGISTAEFSDVQKAYLSYIIQEYVHNFEHDKAHEMLDKMKKSGFKNMHFAWIGSLENNKPHYYRIHSPEFLIEYDNVGFQNDGNHIHAIFRETGNDFGEDILKQHYSESHQ